ncbi:MAG: ATP-binding protein [Candidatus Helarchaeota archaeon]
MANTLISDKLLTKEMKLLDLLAEVDLVGGIYNMGYEECLILTNDFWKQRAGGIPKNCFLLATVIEPGKVPTSEDDEEIILLRVIGPAQLPTENELINIRSDAIREIVTEKGRESVKEPSQIIDVLTRNEIQFSGIRAKILGTFYEEIKGRQRILKFGSDIDNFYSASRYKVYKPYGDSLSIIVNYSETVKKIEIDKKEENNLSSKFVRIGTVRYSSTIRRSKKFEEKKPISVPVMVNIEDFISMKTAIFGMTRLGKSNTMKIIATSVFQYSIENNEKIGQLLFDPAGEYAYINPQDKTALSQLGNEFVIIFKYGKESSDENVEPLKLNFYDESNIENIWQIIRNHLSNLNAQYFKNFIAADVIGPDEGSNNYYSEKYRAERRRSALYATLMKAGFSPPKDFKMKLVVNKKVLEAINEEFDENEKIKSNNKGKVTLNSKNLIKFWERIAKLNKSQDGRLRNTKGELWVDTDLEAILNVFNAPRTRTGFNALKQLRPLHTPHTDEDYIDKIIRELKNGKIVIIDLSKGDENILQYCSERIINAILQDASQSFRNNLNLSKIQIFIEEAHRLFNRTKFEKPNEADPYVRLAKEAAKYKIGLIYATQEVTSVDSQILANTSNWIVTHLNNHKEVKELAKYYDFIDFYDQIIKCEDVGFARIKTKSGRFIIPVQIDLFSPERIKEVQRLINN